MSNIDLYIEQAMQTDGGYRRTKAYPFVSDGLILVQKSEKDFIEMKNRIKKCKELGINIPLYIDYKYDGQNYWILEELAPGKEFAFLVENEDITRIFGKMPYEHLEKYIKDVYLLELNGIGVEPRRRNIFYDEEKGFTTIDVALLSEIEEQDSLKSVSYFFNMFSGVFLVPFSDDDYGQTVREKTVLNIMKAFENGHPFFQKYKRWIYRGDSYFADFLEKHGYNLTLNAEEYEELTDLIESLIDNIVKEKIDNPKDLFNNKDTSYIDLLNSSITYCPQFDLFSLEEQTLNKYIKSSVYNKIKTMFFENAHDNNLRNLYFRIRREELDPVSIYPVEYINEQIEEEIKSITNKKI